MFGPLNVGTCAVAPGGTDCPSSLTVEGVGRLQELEEGGCPRLEFGVEGVGEDLRVGCPRLDLELVEGVGEGGCPRLELELKGLEG